MEPIISLLTCVLNRESPPVTLPQAGPRMVTVKIEYAIGPCKRYQPARILHCPAPLLVASAAVGGAQGGREAKAADEVNRECGDPLPVGHRSGRLEIPQASLVRPAAHPYLRPPGEARIGLRATPVLLRMDIARAKSSSKKWE